MSNNGYKILWDIYILVLLLFISLVVPWRLAFNDADAKDDGWLVAFWIIDGFFLIDIILTFFTSVTDESDFKEITDKRSIAKIYLRKWFIIDVVSIMPVDVFLLAGS